MFKSQKTYVHQTNLLIKETPAETNPDNSEEKKGTLLVTIFFLCTFVTTTFIDTTIYTTLKNDTTGSNIYVVPSGHYI